MASFQRGGLILKGWPHFRGVVSFHGVKDYTVIHSEVSLITGVTSFCWNRSFTKSFIIYYSDSESSGRSDDMASYTLHH